MQYLRTHCGLGLPDSIVAVVSGRYFVVGSVDEPNDVLDGIYYNPNNGNRLGNGSSNLYENASPYDPNFIELTEAQFNLMPYGMPVLMDDCWVVSCHNYPHCRTYESEERWFYAIDDLSRTPFSIDKVDFNKHKFLMVENSVLSTMLERIVNCPLKSYLRSSLSLGHEGDSITISKCVRGKDLSHVTAYFRPMEAGQYKVTLHHLPTQSVGAYVVHTTTVDVDATSAGFITFAELKVPYVDGSFFVGVNSTKLESVTGRLGSDKIALYLQL